MAKNYWLVKSEPSTYSFEQLQKDGKTTWDGVRNYQARNNLRLMKKGDKVLFYHSMQGKEIVGIASVVTDEAYPDPTDDTGKWSVVDLAPDHLLKKPVTLEAIKADPRCEDFLLVRHSRLSVMPVPEEIYELICNSKVQ